MKANDQYILAIDEGTTSARAMILDHQANVVGQAQKEFKQYFPKPGWVEHDADEIWDCVRSVIGEAIINAHIDPYKVRGIGITNQRETTVIWDKKTGKPVYHAIVWQSRQTSTIVDEWKSRPGLVEKIQDKTGLVADAYFPASKIKWILDNVEGCRQKAENGDLLFGTIDTWLVWKLTNGKVHVTDYTNASRTMLFNIRDLNWDQELLNEFNIPSNLLPEIKGCSEIYGYTEDNTMLESRVPICGMAGDQQAALFGHCAFNEGDLKNTYGTGAFLIMNTGNHPVKSEHQLLTSIAYVINDHVNYALEGSIFVAGSAIQWLRDGLKLIVNAADTEQMANSIDSVDGLYVVPSFTGLGAPYWDQDARGAVLGITRGTTKEQFATATLQSLAYQTKDIVDTMVLDTNRTLNNLHVDGGAAKNNYLMQFQADILNAKIIRSKMTEVTALGAAFLAGLAVGFWQDKDELIQFMQTDQEFSANMSADQRVRLYNGWKTAVNATRTFKRN